MKMQNNGGTKIMKDLTKINIIRFNDYTNYDSDKCRNGGCYGFWTDYNRLENGTWEISYGSTADMEFCPCCGSFNDHYEGDDCCYDSGYSCGDFETVMESELLEIINNFTETEDKNIEYKMIRA